MSACIGVCCGALHADRGIKRDYDDSGSSESDDGNNVDEVELAELVNRY